MKSKIFQILTLFLIFVLFLGCEDVIEIDLNSADPKIVIEGKVSTDGEPSQVRITKSTDYYEPGIYEKVTGAEIEITDNDGKSSILTEVNPGLYETNSILGEIGKTYSISVKSEGKIFDAESTIPPQIILDSLGLEIAPYPPGGKTEENKRYFLYFYFQDHPDNEDFGRFRIFNNGKLFGGFTVYWDKYTNGNYIKTRINIGAEENEIKIGDEITVELLSIDKFAYDFYFTANSVNASGRNSGGGPPPSSVAPSNPVTNWTNNALGLFTAFTVSIQSIIVEE